MKRFNELARASVKSEKLFRPRWLDSKPRASHLQWLDKNENGDPELLAFTHELFHSLPPEVIFTYPELGQLYRRLASWVGVNPESILLTAGSDGAIRAVFETFIEPGDVVIHTAPTFAMYPVYAQMYGAVPQVLTYERSVEGPVLSLDDLQRALKESDAKLLCLPNPDSPTGTIIEPQTLRQIIALAAEHGTMVLIDEAYHPYYPHSVVSMIKDFSNLVVARTFAKAWGLAGARVGYAIAEESILTLLHKVRPMYEVNTIGAALIDRMLDHPNRMQASVDRLNSGKDFFVSEMKNLGYQTLKSHGNFLHVAFGDRAAAVHQELAQLVLYRENFKEDCLSGYSRFSATSREGFVPLVEAVRSVSLGQVIGA